MHDRNRCFISLKSDLENTYLFKQFIQQQVNITCKLHYSDILPMNSNDDDDDDNDDSNINSLLFYLCCKKKLMPKDE